MREGERGREGEGNFSPSCGVNAHDSMGNGIDFAETYSSKESMPYDQI